MNLDFNKVWASDTSPEFPTDTQTKRGLSFLGTEAPTFDLHDAIFQRLDLKVLFLYDQIRIACERFGQDVDNSVAGAARDTMANAITNALLTQRKADEGGYGIVRMANADQTSAGNDHDLAVSPKHLAEYVSAQNTWANTKDKPQTATRWPDYSEVKNTPNLGAAAYYGITKHSQISNAWDLSYDDNNLSTIAQCASVRDAVNSALGDKISSLAEVAKTGSYLSLNNKPFLSDSTTKMMRYGADLSDYTKISYADDRIPSEAIIAMARDGLLSAISALDKSLSVIAKTGKISDAIGVGKAAGYGVTSHADVSNAWNISYDDSTLATIAQCASVRDAVNNALMDLSSSLSGVAKSGDYADLKGIPYLGDASNKKVSYGVTPVNDIPFDDESVASTALLATVVKGIKTPGEILSTITAIKLNHHTSIEFGETVSGYNLYPCGTEYGYENHGQQLSGTWVCSGRVLTSDSQSSGVRTSTWVRIS